MIKLIPLIPIRCENSQGEEKLCLAHLSEGRVLTCPYQYMRDLALSEYHCLDYKPE